MSRRIEAWEREGLMARAMGAQVMLIRDLILGCELSKRVEARF